MTEQLAIIRSPHIGIEDHSMRLSLFFDTYISEGRAAYQIVPLPEINIPHITFDVSKLEGQPCWVQVDGNFIRFVRFWNQENPEKSPESGRS